MENTDRKSHWERIYQTRELHEVSWYQPTPEPSLQMLRELGVQPAAKVIDIGGGDSLLVDHLLDLGFSDITVLDISEMALERAQRRLGSRADRVKWVAADVTTFEPREQYDVWHDRAAFHFLLQEEETSKYVLTAQKHLTPSGFLIVGTFSDAGPEKCSGLPVRRYSEFALADCFSVSFKKIFTISNGHKTPSGTVQDFIFCGFKKVAEAR